MLKCVLNVRDLALGPKPVYLLSAYYQKQNPRIGGFKVINL